MSWSARIRHGTRASGEPPDKTVAIGLGSASCLTQSSGKVPRPGARSVPDPDRGSLRAVPGSRRASSRTRRRGDRTSPRGPTEQGRESGRRRQPTAREGTPQGRRRRECPETPAGRGMRRTKAISRSGARQMQRDSADRCRLSELRHGRSYAPRGDSFIMRGCTRRPLRAPFDSNRAGPISAP